MDDFEGDIRPPELSSWALSLLRGTAPVHAAETDTASRNSTYFTKRQQTQTTTQTQTAGSKANRFFKSLNLGQASRLNEEGVFEPLVEERKRKSNLLTPQKHSPKRKDVCDDNSVEVARRAEVKESLQDIKMGNVWNTKDDFVLDFKDVPSKTASRRISNPIGGSAQAQTTTQASMAPVAPASTSKYDNIVVNCKTYTVLEQIGKGGSSKVYKAHANKRTYAIKVVDIDDDEESTTLNELKGEIQILKKLRECPRVIQLVDYEFQQDSIKIVMECGEIDLAHVIQTRFKTEGFNEEFVRFHVNEMIQCISQVHAKGIVHSDLKPANFIFVRGTLKLIDFGISNAINGATVNVYRECQMGTPNYMAPETLVEVANDSNSIWRIGKPSDVWSIGCITYQLTYGHPPYHAYQGTKKILAITNPKVAIEFPSVSGGTHVPEALVQFMKRCLVRNPKQRHECHELLRGPFLSPICLSKGVLRDIVKWSVVYGGRHPEIGRGLSSKGKKEDGDDLERRSQAKLDTLVESLIEKVNQR